MYEHSWGRSKQKPMKNVGLDWIEQGLTSPPTQYRLSGRQFYRSKDPTNSIKVLKEKLASHRLERLKTHHNSRGRSQGVPKICRAPMYRVHCDSTAFLLLMCSYCCSCYKLYFKRIHTVFSVFFWTLPTQLLQLLPVFSV